MTNAMATATRTSALTFWEPEEVKSRPSALMTSNRGDVGSLLDSGTQKMKVPGRSAGVWLRGAGTHAHARSIPRENEEGPHRGGSGPSIVSVLTVELLRGWGGGRSST